MPHTPGSTCDGKRRHRNRNAAFKHLRNLVAGGSDRLTLSIYLCPYCNWWHVGHVAKGTAR